MNKELVAYAYGFVSYLMQNMDRQMLLNIKDIILFGSAARGEAGKDSDVDIFVNVVRDDKKTADAVSRSIGGFYKTEAFRMWKLMGIENEIKCVTGRLEEWKDLKTSIMANGITLYGKYKALTKGSRSVVIYWGKVKPESKRVLLSKKLYGYNYKGKGYKGLLEVTKSVKLGGNCIVAPMDNCQMVFDMFRQLEIKPKVIYISRL